MSKELTDQWRNRTLIGRWYYIRVLGNIEIARLSKYNQFYHLPITNGYAANKDVSEVLAQVPDYKSLCELKTEFEICKDDKADLYAKLCNALMQLEEANKLIGMIGCQTKNEDLEKCIEYCKKFGVK